MTDIPNLAGVATSDLVEKIGAGSFSASYINWARTMHLLRVHAPGWLPELVKTSAGQIVHEAPNGAFLLIRFRHTDGTVTPEVPQAIMDSRNAAVALAKVTARDITDTHRRGVCMAAAMTFGLAYELWAKLPMESGYAEQPEGENRPLNIKGSPTEGIWEAMEEEERAYLLKVAANVAQKIAQDGPEAAHAYLESLQLEAQEKAALWTRFDSKVRSALKKAHAAATKEAA